jgi:hypothetical protein
MQAEKNRRGFTLAELLFAMTASTLLVGGILASFIVFSRLFRDGSELLDIHSRARYVTERIARGVSAAEVLTVQSGGDRLDVTVPATTLRSAVNPTHTSIHVEGTTMLSPSGIVYVDEEAIAYTSIDSKNLLGCARGANQTTATKHDNKEIVYARFSYYLDGTTIYLNADGSPAAATDESIIRMVEKNQGTSLFQLIRTGSSSFRSDRVVLSFTCFDDRNHNNRRDALEPSFNVAFEVFARNT